MIVYADSSFLVSSYTGDAHSIEADKQRALLPTILITPFVRAEVCAALHQQVFQKRVSLAQANTLGRISSRTATTALSPESTSPLPP